MSRRITKVYVHCSASAFGDAAAIDVWHESRGFRSKTGKHIGYHYVVLNGRRYVVIDPSTGRAEAPYEPSCDGAVETGRAEDEAGAHVEGDNADSIGVCMIGLNGLFTVAQVRSAVCLIKDILVRYGLSWTAVHGHYEAPTAVAAGKTCPDFRIDTFRALMRGSSD